MKIPAAGTPQDELFATMEAYRENDLPWRGGKAWGYVYDAGEAISAVAKRAYTMYMTENGLDPTAFASLARFENDLIAMAAAHLNAPEGAVGNFTSGGTESIILAVKAARNHARRHRPEVTAPEMILPSTAHAAFHKAARYLGVKVVVTPVDPASFKADVAAIEAAITENTILIVGSATSYAHGVIDPIAAMGQLAKARGLLLHVDACIGGFLLPYFARLGDDIPTYDFRIEGVTSMSMDYHKYAYCPKGASVVVYRDKALRQHQIFACADWTGYSVVNATVQSSKSGGPLAAAWAVLNFVGDEGYLEIARKLRDSSRAIIAGVQEIPGLRLLGAPEMSLIAMASDEVNVFHVIDEMKARGWYVQAQLSYGDSPRNIHLSVAPSNVPQTEALLADLRDSVAAARELPASALDPELAAMLADIDPTDLGDGDFGPLLAMVGLDGSRLPERMAMINEILDMMPVAAREAILIGFFNDLFTPTSAAPATAGA